MNYLIKHDGKYLVTIPHHGPGKWTTKVVEAKTFSQAHAEQLLDIYPQFVAEKCIDEGSLIVYHHDKVVLQLNENLLTTQHAWDNLDELKVAHELRLVIEELMGETSSNALARSLYADWTIIQFELQRLWNFKENAMYHRHWTLPKCTCPKYDNEDAFPHHKYISGNCVLHGSTK